MSDTEFDPTRYVKSASVAMLLLGLLQLLAASCVMIAFFQTNENDPPNVQVFAQSLLLGVEIFAFLSSVLLLICAYKIKRGRKWAAIIGLVITGCVLCLYVFSIIAFLMSATRNADTATSGLMIYCAGIVVGCVVTLLFLIRSFDGMRFINGTEPRGFEVLDVHETKSKS